MAVISAFETAGGVQLNEVGPDTGTIHCRMVMPDDPGWEAAQGWLTAPLIQRTYYDPAIGRVLAAMQSPDAAFFGTAPEGAPFIDGFWPEDGFYIEGGAAVPLPENTTPGFAFDL